MLDRENNIKHIYEMILEGKYAPELFSALARNFVKPQDPLLKALVKDPAIKPGKGALFEKASGLYRADTYGFVHYEGLVAVEVLPVVYLNPDQSRAMLILPPQDKVRTPVYLEHIVTIINALEIKTPVDHDAISQAVQASLNENRGVAAVFAEGKAPLHGKVAKVIIDYSFKVDAGKETKGGKIDFRERGFVHNVHAGEVIAHYDEAVDPVNGMDIYGNIIKASMDKDPIYRLGKNVEGDQYTKDIIATIDGIISIGNGVLSVFDGTEIAKDVDYATGNIEAQGSVVIRGGITPGFVVKAKGDVLVHNNVEDAVIESAGNIIVLGGIIGGEKSSIKAQGHIKAGFIRNAKIEAFGDVIIEQSVMNSEIKSDGRIVCISGKGVIIGGKMSATSGIFANIIGAPSGTQTELLVGRSLGVEGRLKEIYESIKNGKEQMKKIKMALGDEYFKNPKDYLMRLPPAKIPMVKELLTQVTEIMKKSGELELEKNQLLDQAHTQSKSTVSAMQTIFEGVTIFINHLKRVVEKEISGTEFYYMQDYDAIGERAPHPLDPKKYSLQ